MNTTYRYFCIILVMAMGAFSVTACDLYDPTRIHDTPIRLERADSNYDFDVHEMTPATYSAIAGVYDKAGQGDVNVTVTYDATNGHGSSHARDHLSRVITGLRGAGITTVNGNIMPVHEMDLDSRVLITHESLSAKPPLGCSDMPGMNDSSVRHDDAYKFGCAKDTLFVKQLARPKDLLGDARLPDTGDARRNAVVIESYRSGVPNESLEGQSASGDE